MHLPRYHRQLSVAACVALLTSACLGGGSPASDDTVEIMYGFELDQSSAFQASLKGWAATEGIALKFSPSPDFGKLVRARAAGDSPPDLAIFPQPGITLDLARAGHLDDLGDVLDIPALRRDIVPGVLEAATDPEGRVYAAPIAISVKSLVWYPKPEFEAAGYQVPSSLDELSALTEQIRSDGIAPWCVGVEDGHGTGWVVTDWIEDYLIRQAGVDTYDKWVRHEIPFNDPSIKRAAQSVGEIWFGSGNVLGGRSSIASTKVNSAASPMFATPPMCMLHRQASFLAQPGSFPPEVLTDLDNRVGIFPFPPAQEGAGQPIMGGGDLAALFRGHDPAAERVLAYLTGPDYKGWPEQSGFVSPRREYDVELQPNQTMRDIARIAYSAQVFRFDGSDSMPGEVGTGSFWRGSVDWVKGRKSLDDFLLDVEKSWPRS